MSGEKNIADDPDQIAEILGSNETFQVELNPQDLIIPGLVKAKVESARPIEGEVVDDKKES